MNVSEAVNRVAEAIFRCRHGADSDLSGVPESIQEQYRAMARAAIEANEAHAEALQEQTIRWTRTETMACAYFWAEFNCTELSDIELPAEDSANWLSSPETAWLGASEDQRQESRNVVRRRLVVDTALGEAVAMPHPGTLSNADLVAIGKAIGIGMKTPEQIREAARSLYQHFAVPQPWDDTPAPISTLR